MTVELVEGFRKKFGLTGEEMGRLVCSSGERYQRWVKCKRMPQSILELYALKLYLVEFVYEEYARLDKVFPATLEESSSSFATGVLVGYKQCLRDLESKVGTYYEQGVEDGGLLG